MKKIHSNIVIQLLAENLVLYFLFEGAELLRVKINHVKQLGSQVCNLDNLALWTLHLKLEMGLTQRSLLL